MVQESTLNIEGTVVGKIGSRFFVSLQAKVIHTLWISYPLTNGRYRVILYLMNDEKETFQYGPYQVTINGDGTETWREGDWSITIPSHLTRSDCE